MGPADGLDVLEKIQISDRARIGSPDHLACSIVTTLTMLSRFVNMFYESFRCIKINKFICSFSLRGGLTNLSFIFHHYLLSIPIFVF